MLGNYTVYVNRFPTYWRGRYVLSDGTHYAHCKTIKQGINDLRKKQQRDNDLSCYKELTLDSVLSFDEAKKAYRTITYACEAGTEGFIKSLETVKESYRISEIVSLTRGKFGHTEFAKFFKEKKGCTV